MTGQLIRVFQRMLPTKMLMLVALGALAGAIVSGLFIRSGSIRVLLLAAASGLGAIILWRLCKAQNRRIDRLQPGRLNRSGGAGVQRIAVARLDRMPNALVAFHDFNTARGCFDHW